MTLQASNVRVAVTGGIYRADPETTAPTSALGTLDAGFDELGYVSEDGITQAIGAEVSSIKAWQGGDEVRKVQTSHALTYAATLIETSELTLETYYGNFEDLGDGEGLVRITSDQPEHYSWALHMVDGVHRIRLYIPDGQVTERGDVVWVNASTVAYPVTISCFPDDEGVKAYKYIADTSVGS